MLDDKSLENEAEETPQEEAPEVEASATEETPVAEEATTTEEPVAEEPVAEEATTTEEAAVEEAVVEATAEETTTAEEETTEEPVAEEATEEAGDDSETTDSAEEEEEEVVLPTKELDLQSPHDEFDWTVTNKHGLAYTDEQIEDYLKQYESTLTSVLENEIVSGTVTSIHDGDVVLDINYKSDGLVSLSEFRDMPDLKIGDPVEVYVEQQEDIRGQLVLSLRKAKLLRAWESIVDSYENGTVIKGTIISKTKGGLIADCGGLETFLPGSQIDIKPIIDYDSYVWQIYGV